MAETPEEKRARLISEIKERASELMKDEPDVQAHSLSDETVVFQGDGEVAAHCIGYYSDD